MASREEEYNVDEYNVDDYVIELNDQSSYYFSNFNSGLFWQLSYIDHLGKFRWRAMTPDEV